MTPGYGIFPLRSPFALRTLHRHRGAGASADQLPFIGGRRVEERAQEGVSRAVAVPDAVLFRRRASLS
jgi:hypothetical protein